ncbi:hypothetical protein D3C72_1758480 [compost metagenome]
MRVAAHGVVAAGAQPHALLRPVFVERSAHPVRLVRLRHRHDTPLPIKQHQAGIHGVQAVDFLEDCRGLAAAHRARLQRARKLRRQRPPAAIVGALVQVAVQYLHGQRGAALRVAQHGPHHNAVQVLQSAFKGLGGLARCGADL